MRLELVLSDGRVFDFQLEDNLVLDTSVMQVGGRWFCYDPRGQGLAPRVPRFTEVPTPLQIAHQWPDPVTEPAIQPRRFFGKGSPR